MAKPLAVITGDVHFTMATLEVATQVVVAGLAKAKELGVPLILNGDTLDGKSVVRAEIMNRLIDLLVDAPVQVIVNVGNHDLANNRGSEHALNFLDPYCDVVDEPTYFPQIKSHVIPYMDSPEDLRSEIAHYPVGSRLIVHCGVQTADMGHYVQDKSSLPKEAFARFRTIGSHYHGRQDIQCAPIVGPGNVGLFTYCGSPYTVSFAEANDCPKGLNVIYDDGQLGLIPLNLRRHIILNAGLRHGRTIGHDDEFNREKIRPEDLVWVKLQGKKSDLNKVDKKSFGETYLNRTDYKLDLLPDEDCATIVKADTMTEQEILDSLIDGLNESDLEKSALKTLWRELNETG